MSNKNIQLKCKHFLNETKKKKKYNVKLPRNDTFKKGTHKHKNESHQ